MGKLIKSDFLAKYYELVHQNQVPVFAEDGKEWKFIVLKKKPIAAMGEKNESGPLLKFFEDTLLKIKP